MTKYIIKDWADNVCFNSEQDSYDSFESASEQLDIFCNDIVQGLYPTLDNMTDSFGNLVDDERGEYIIVEVKE